MKLIVVSPPRSGSTMFARALSTAASKLDGVGEMPYAHKDNWVMAKHEHIILYGKYEDVSICTIVRDPLDTLSSNIDRWIRGYVGVVVNGIEVIDKDNNILEMTDAVKKFIDQSVDLYLAYLIAIDTNIDSLITLTHDQIKNNPIESVNNVLSMFGLDTQNYSRDDVIEILSHPYSDKSTLYGEIRKYLATRLENVYEIYWRIMEKVSQKQETYPVKLNPVKL